MEVIHFKSAETYEPQESWVRKLLCNQKDISIEHFVKPPSHSSPVHSHPNAQILYVLDGEIVVETNKDARKLEKGDCVYIPGDESHKVINPLNIESVGLDIFLPGRSFDFWTKRNK